MEILKVELPIELSSPILALGAEMKRGFSLVFGNVAHLRIGNDSLVDLETLDLHRREIDELLESTGKKPALVAIDSHPLYLNRKIASDFGVPVVEVQHHRAHIASVMADNNVRGRIIGVSLDGTGYGDDGAIWGGEFFVGDYSRLERVGHLKYFPLQGGDRAAIQTWRPALGIFFTLEPQIAEKIADGLGPEGRMVLSAIKNSLGVVSSSSTGRLFDAAAFLILGIKENNIEAEAPIALEKASQRNEVSYKFSIEEKNGKLLLCPFPAFIEIMEDKRSPELKAYSFHSGLALGIKDVVLTLRERTGINRVALSGGVFQNRLLTGILIEELKSQEFHVLAHKKFPPHDGSLSVGQGILAGMR